MWGAKLTHKALILKNTHFFSYCKEVRPGYLCSCTINGMMNATFICRLSRVLFQPDDEWWALDSFS